MSRKDNDSAASGGRVAAHILAFVGVTLLAVVILLVAAGLMLKFGPSPAAGERFGELAAEKGAPAFISELFAPVETEAPAETETPAETEAPTETDAPVEATDPVESEDPAETAEVTE